MDHALDEVFDQLDEDAERGNAGDVALELIAELVGHEADLLPLHELALRVVGAALALGGVPGHLRQLVGQLVSPFLRHPLPRFAKRAMHDEIRIPPDRRREVRVAVGREPEVPEVRRVVPRLLHRSQHQKGDGLLLRLARDPLDER